MKIDSFITSELKLSRKLTGELLPLIQKFVEEHDCYISFGEQKEKLFTVITEFTVLGTRENVMYVNHSLKTSINFLHRDIFKNRPLYNPLLRN